MTVIEFYSTINIIIYISSFLYQVFAYGWTKISKQKIWNQKIYHRLYQKKLFYNIMDWEKRSNRDKIVMNMLKTYTLYEHSNINQKFFGIFYSLEPKGKIISF